jgi:hypothetical protein
VDPRKLTFDSRLAGYCAYCGCPPATRDHCPPRFFLDDPLPDDLPVVDACGDCNSGHSLDEEYFACFLDAVVTGTAVPGPKHRSKVRATLERKPQLVADLSRRASIEVSGDAVWAPDEDRTRRIVMKLARGHATFELASAPLEEPTTYWVAPLLALPDVNRQQFEAAGSSHGLWPEIGSRAFYRSLGALPYPDAPWVVVQPNRYRYSVADGTSVWIVLSEYLAAYVEWS